MSNWYRDSKLNNFFVEPKGANSPWVFTVKFINMCQWELARDISITYTVMPAEGGSQISLQMGFGGFPRENLDKLIKVVRENNYQTEYFEIYKNITTPIIFRGFDNFYNIIVFMWFINKSMNLEIFSPDIVFEFLMIDTFAGQYVKKKANCYYYGNPHILEFPHYLCHRLPILPNIEDYLNPHRLTSAKLVKLLYAHRETEGELDNDTYNKVKMLLAEGENPNQFHPIHEATPLIICAGAIGPLKDNRVIMLLIHYHADITNLRNGSITASVLDLAHYLEDVELINILTSLFSKPEQPRFKVKNTHLLQTPDKLETSFDLYVANDPERKVVDVVSTELKEPDNAEKQQIIVMSTQTFSYPSANKNTQLSGIIEDEINNTKNIIEVVKNRQREFIGFNIYRIINANDKLYWYCCLSLLSPNYRNMGLVSILTWRYAFLLQYLYPEIPVGIFLVAIHPNSYRLAQNYLHWPMYQPEHLRAEVPQILRVIGLEDDVSYYHNGLTCYIDKELEVKNTGKQSNSFNNSYYYLCLLGQLTMKSTESKGVPVLFYTSDLTFRTLKHICEKIELNLDTHLSQLVLPFSYFLSMFRLQPLTKPSINPQKVFHNSRDLFWNNEPTAKSTKKSFSTRLMAKL